jgi:hypothetical protein
MKRELVDSITDLCKKDILFDEEALVLIEDITALKINPNELDMKLPGNLSLEGV